MPGPGTYETDVIPQNQQNIEYWMGTDVRKPLSVRNSHMYPGPGSHEVIERNPGSFIGFTQDKKKTQVIKTDDPSPASYFLQGSVGVIAEYSNHEANPRPEPISAKNKRNLD